MGSGHGVLHRPSLPRCAAVRAVNREFEGEQIELERTEAWRAAAAAAEDADAVGVGCRAVVERAQRVTFRIQARDVAQAATLCTALHQLQPLKCTPADAYRSTGNVWQSTPGQCSAI